MDGKLHKKRPWRPLLYVICILTIREIIEYGGACKGILTSQILSIFFVCEGLGFIIGGKKFLHDFQYHTLWMHLAWSIYNIGWIRSSKQTLFIILW